MTDRQRQALHAAVMGALLLLDTDDDIELADAILDAITPVLDEGVTVEWAYRYPNGHVATWIPMFATEDVVRAAAADYPDLLTVVRRRVGEWEVA